MSALILRQAFPPVFLSRSLSLCLSLSDYCHSTTGGKGKKKRWGRKGGGGHDGAAAVAAAAAMAVVGGYKAPRVGIGFLVRAWGLVVRCARREGPGVISVLNRRSS